MLPGFTASYSIFRTRHVYRGDSSPSWIASEMGDVYTSDSDNAAVSSLNHIVASLVLPALKIGNGGVGPPPPKCTTKCQCSDDCNLTCTTTCIPGGKTTSTRSCCALGGSCQRGACVCPPSTQVCDATGICRNLQTDPNNCGECGFSCNGGSCSAGYCGNCPSGFVLCGGTCVNPQTDASNCGSCGHQCNPGVGCVAGLCQCPQGQTWGTSKSKCIPGQPVLQYYATLNGPLGGSASVDMCYCTLGPLNTPMANQTPDQCTQAHFLGIPGSVTGLWNFPDTTCCAQQGLTLCGGTCCPSGQICVGGSCVPPPPCDCDCGTFICNCSSPPGCNCGACDCCSECCDDCADPDICDDCACDGTDDDPCCDCCCC
jgi:hypothetical protein